jgi:hypothetical protein
MSKHMQQLMNAFKYDEYHQNPNTQDIEDRNACSVYDHRRARRRLSNNCRSNIVDGTPGLHRTVTVMFACHLHALVSQSHTSRPPSST